MWSSVFPPESARGGHWAGRWRLLTRPQDACVGSSVCLLGSPSVVFTSRSTCREQRLEKLPLLWRPVFSIACGGGPTAPLLTGTWRGVGGGWKARRRQLELAGLHLSQRLPLPPQVGFDQHQAGQELHQDLVLRTSQWTGLDETREGQVKVEDQGGGDKSGAKCSSWTCFSTKKVVQMLETKI